VKGVLSLRDKWGNELTMEQLRALPENALVFGSPQESALPASSKTAKDASLVMDGPGPAALDDLSDAAAGKLTKHASDRMCRSGITRREMATCLWTGVRQPARGRAEYVIHNEMTAVQALDGAVITMYLNEIEHVPCTPEHARLLLGLRVTSDFKEKLRVSAASRN